MCTQASRPGSRRYFAYNCLNHDMWYGDSKIRNYTSPLLASSIRQVWQGSSRPDWAWVSLWIHDTLDTGASYAALEHTQTCSIQPRRENYFLTVNLIFWFCCPQMFIKPCWPEMLLMPSICIRTQEARSWEHKVASLRGTLMSFFMPKLGKIIGMTRTGPRE